MKTFFKVSWLMLLFIYACSEKNVIIESEGLLIELNDKGELVSLRKPNSDTEYLSGAEKSPVLSLGINGQEYMPQSAEIDKEAGLIQLGFDELGVNANILFEEKGSYVNFELKEISGDKSVDYVVWGPYKTNLSKRIGETVGVVQGDDYALGIQALNIRTLGGYPTNEDDTEPAYDIFASNDLVDVSDSIKVLYRGQTARKMDYGSKLQAYARYRGEAKVIPVWGHEKYQVPAYDDEGVIGSKIALFGSQPDKALNIIGEIEQEEGLPHPKINGEWIKTNPEATSSYLIMSFGEGNIEEALDLTKQAGLKYLYHGGPFENWGHFKLHEKSFPDNWESMKVLVERAEKDGIHLGVHTLSNFITTNDPYVSPVPDGRLAKVGLSVLVGNIDESTKNIPVESPDFFNQMKNNNLHAVQIGDELIRYKSVSTEKPWELLDCERGAFGTKASGHKEGSKVSKLMDHGYKTFLGNAELSDEMAIRIADFCNTTGIKQISFDGLEGNWASGMGQYSRQLFVNKWYQHLKPELRGEIINDASNPGHYFWHIFTRMNWGEPWYAGFRESQTQYRLMNQDYFDRNLMPNMLGWFSLSSGTSIMDAEWLLARAAGFDAGFGLSTSFQAIKENGKSSEILNKISIWEEARLAGAFNNKQKEGLKNIDNEYSLEKVGDNQWALSEVFADIHRLTQKEKQPGEPVFHSLEFTNSFEPQPLKFIISSEKGQGPSKIKMEIDNFSKLEVSADLRGGNMLAYEGGDHAVLYDKHWNKIKEIKLDPTKLEVSNGKHEMILDMNAANGDEIKVELILKGKAAVIKGK
ncbi:hypothetical protein [Echinicola shivajiensis]|uniref:hypothetical protein n=1 Tax=Echinicola shivajiensis TaxID=1035916 RepID=UPI001BFC8C68|nr:hypothetical protein [Echinicola shivajiensis]